MFGRRVQASWFGLAVLALGLPAQAAWVETRVRSHTATVDVERDGRALVRQELTLGVRGGPLRTFEIPGVDQDAEIDNEHATVTPIVKYGVPAAIPLTLQKQEDGTLAIEIEREKGLFTGGYVLRFEYKTSLLARDRIRRRGTRAEVEWVGPRFPDGIDVAKVVFRLPEAPSSPELGSSDSDEQSLGSVFLGLQRHADGKAEIELVRPHVARGEPAVWRVSADPKAFDGLPEPNESVERVSARVVAMERPQERAAWGSFAVGLATLYSLLVWLKWAAFSRRCRARQAEARPLVPLPIGLRAALAGASLATAAVLFLLGDYPTVAALALLSACGLAAIGSPRHLPEPRGPGHWFALAEADCISAGANAGAARWLDAGNVRGLMLLLAFAAADVTAAVLVSARSPFHALCLLLGALALLPIFGSGRERQLPVDRVNAPRKLLFQLKHRLAVGQSGRSLAAARKPNAHGLKLVPWARIPDGQRDPDELRLLLRAQQLVDGVCGIEVGIEYQPGAAGYWQQPYVLVRAREGSPAHAALAPVLRFQRGRSADERVAIARPTLPNAAGCERLLLELCAQLSPPASRTSVRKTGGAGSLTSKLGIASPAHAT